MTTHDKWCKKLWFIAYLLIGCAGCAAIFRSCWLFAFFILLVPIPVYIDFKNFHKE